MEGQKESPNAYGRKGPENPNHYADIDLAIAGQPSLDQQTPTAASLSTATWKAYYKAIGWNAVSQRGLLPFRVWQIYKQMEAFVRAKDVASFIAAAGILAHYIGDACQPLHGSFLDDGDPFRNPDGTPSATMLDHGKGFGNGVHTAYEKKMLDDNYDDLIEGVSNELGATHGMALVTDGRHAGFATIELMRRTTGRLKPMDIVEEYAAIKKAGKTSSAGALLWAKFKAPTITCIADGCRTPRDDLGECVGQWRWRRDRRQSASHIFAEEAAWHLRGSELPAVEAARADRPVPVSLLRIILRCGLICRAFPAGCHMRVGKTLHEY